GRRGRRAPVGREPLRLAGRTKPNEAAGRTERPPDLGDRDPRAGGEPLDRPYTSRDVSDEALSRERLVERTGRARPLERQRRVGRQRLHERYLLAREGALGRGRRGDEDADDPLPGDQRDEGAALGAGRLDETRAHERRARAVEDDHRPRLEVGARDPGRFLIEIEPNVAPPADVAALGAR